MTETVSLHGSTTKHVTMIFGPDHKGESIIAPIAEDAFSNMQKAGLRVLRVGNGRKPVRFGNIENVLSTQPPDAVVIILVHGTIHLPVHELGLGNEQVPTRRLFNILGRTGRRTDVLLLSCGAGITHDDAEKRLPTGSRMATFTSGSNKLYRPSAVLSADSIGRATAGKELSFSKLVLESLPGAISVSSPVITLAGTGTCVLGDMIAERRDRGFTLAEMRNIRSAGQRSWLDTIRLCKDIRTARVTELSNTSAKYGDAFAAVVAASGDRLPFKPRLSAPVQQ